MQFAKKIFILNEVIIALVFIVATIFFVQNQAMMNSYKDQSAQIIEKSNIIENLQKENNALHEKQLNSQSNIKFIIHTVKQNENLMSICEVYHIDYYANKNIILSLNGLKNPDRIYQGQNLILPVYD